ncbi:MAG TPA: hypothetical protein VK830_09290 [Xanthomonadales bacterium]|nr:hypothetical protein [Xanthomonadales bacterium]
MAISLDLDRDDLTGFGALKEGLAQVGAERFPANLADLQDAIPNAKSIFQGGHIIEQVDPALTIEVEPRIGSVKEIDVGQVGDTC